MQKTITNSMENTFNDMLRIEFTTEKKNKYSKCNFWRKKVAGVNALWPFNVKFNSTEWAQFKTADRRTYQVKNEQQQRHRAARRTM